MDKHLMEIVMQLKEEGYIGANGRIENHPAFVKLENLARGAHEDAPEPKKVTPVTPTPKGKPK